MLLLFNNTLSPCLIIKMSNSCFSTVLWASTVFTVALIVTGSWFYFQGNAYAD